MDGICQNNKPRKQEARSEEKSSTSQKYSKTLYFAIILIGVISIIAIALSSASIVMLQMNKQSNDLSNNSMDLLGVKNELNLLQVSLSSINESISNQVQSDLANCKELQNSGIDKSGVYSINVAGKKVEVYCDMETANGGWTVFQKRLDGSVDFYRNFTQYEDGFGNKNGEYWLGLIIMREMTSLQNYELRVDLEDFEGNEAYALYNNFKIDSSSTNYVLQVSGYSGTAGDSLAKQNNRSFTTFDQDNDAWSENCAVEYHGAWWYYRCYLSNLNGKYIAHETTSGNSINWKTWKNAHTSLKRTEMKIRPN